MEKEYLINDFSPKHLILKPDEIEIYDLNNTFVRVEVETMGKKEQLDTQKEMTTKYDVLSFTFKQKEKKEKDKEMLLEAAAILQNEDEMLAQYIKATGVPAGLDSKRLSEKGKECIKSV